MRKNDFHVRAEFICGGNRFRVTDVGARVIVAIALDQDDPRNYNGPPYSIAEQVFDEYDMQGCEPAADDAEHPDLANVKQRVVEAIQAGRVAFAPGVEDAIRSISRDDPDFTITQTDLACAWGKNRHSDGGFEIHWRTVSAGAGCTTFYLKDGKLRCDNETMGPAFVKSVLSDLVDRTVFDD